MGEVYFNYNSEEIFFFCGRRGSLKERRIKIIIIKQNQGALGNQIP